MTKDKQQSILYTFTTLLQTILSMFLGWCNFCTYQEFYHIFYKFTYNQLIIVVCAEFAHTTIISFSSIDSLRKVTTFSRALQIITRTSSVITRFPYLTLKKTPTALHAMGWGCLLCRLTSVMN